MLTDSRFRRAGLGLDGVCKAKMGKYASEAVRGRIAAVSTVWRCYGPYTRTRAPAHTRIGNTSYTHTNNLILIIT